MGIVRSLKKIFKNSKNSEKNQRLSDIENAKFENDYASQRKKAKAVSRQKVFNAYAFFVNFIWSRDSIFFTFFRI